MQILLQLYDAELTDKTILVVPYSAIGGPRAPGLDSSMGSSSSELETTLGEVGIKNKYVPPLRKEFCNAGKT